MPLAARILFGVFGIVAAVYAAASLSGNRLSTPPWWEREATRGTVLTSNGYGPPVRRTFSFRTGTMEPFPGRELISVGVGAVGLAAVAFAAWPRRRPGKA